MADLCYCKTCKRTLDASNFYTSYNAELFPSGHLDECKKCATMMVDNFDPDTFKPLLEKIDIPYVPSKWLDLLQKYSRDPAKVTGMTIIGRYISAMRLKQWREFRYKDSEYLQTIEEEKAKVAMKSSGYDAATIDKYITERREALNTTPERPTTLPPIPESFADIAGGLQVGNPPT